jgi:ribosomal protein S12 methylthiotransferase
MRGLQKSQPIEWNIMEAKRLVKQGVKELLVIAQDSTSYGWDLSPKSSLHEMMYALDEIDGLEWIRLHYAHPAHLHRDMINAYSEFKRVIPYIDMPVQHASDRMLTLMRRGLKSNGIKKRIDSLRKVNPNIAIRTSIIVGFPDETDEDFKQLMDMIKEVQFDRLGVFTYSEEDGTYAEAHMKDNIPREVKEDRLDAVMRAQQVINLKKNQALVGQTDMVIVDKITDEGWSIARSYRDAPEIDNHIRIKGNHPEGEFLNVKYTQAYEYDLLAEVVNV